MGESNANKNETAANAGTFDFSKLTITNRFMFPLVMSHKEIAKPFIEAALGIKIYDLKDPEQEKTEQVSVFGKSVRYDVYTQEIDENGETIRSFDLEMQMEDTMPRKIKTSPLTTELSRIIIFLVSIKDSRTRTRSRCT